MTASRIVRRALPVGVAIASLVVASCASDDDGGDAGESGDAPAGTEAPADPAPDAEEPADEAAPDQPADDNGEGASPTTVLEPDASADLPTARPDDPAPATTVPGPLPVPSVQLIEEAAESRDMLAADPVEVGNLGGIVTVV